MMTMTKGRTASSVMFNGWFTQKQDAGHVTAQSVFRCRNFTYTIHLPSPTLHRDSNWQSISTKHLETITTAIRGWRTVLLKEPQTGIRNWRRTAYRLPEFCSLMADHVRPHVPLHITPSDLSTCNTEHPHKVFKLSQLLITKINIIITRNKRKQMSLIFHWNKICHDSHPTSYAEGTAQSSAFLHAVNHSNVIGRR